MPSEVSQDLEHSRLASLVARVLAIHDTTLGTPNQNYRLRFRGRLLKDSVEAYDELAAALRPAGFTPLFRQEGEDHVVLLVQGVHEPRASDARVNLVLFVLTLLSVLFVGASMSYTGPVSGAGEVSFLETLLLIGRNLPAGLPFAVSLLGILGVHEFGHYLAARRNRTAVSLPYFIPLPMSVFGTMGAFISMKEPPRNRRVLVDIAVTGPLAGLVVAIPVLLYGLSLSRIEPLPSSFAGSQQMMLEGNSLLYLLAKFLVFGRMLPEPVLSNARQTVGFRTMMAYVPALLPSCHAAACARSSVLVRPSTRPKRYGTSRSTSRMVIFFCPGPCGMPSEKVMFSISQPRCPTPFFAAHSRALASAANVSGSSVAPARTAASAAFWRERLSM